MSLETLNPHPDYPMLLRQFHALKTIALSQANQLSVYQAEKWQERQARNELDSERAANAALTAEVEALRAKIALYEITRGKK